MLDDFAAIVEGRIFQRSAIRELLIQRPYRSRFALTVAGDVRVFEVGLNDGVVRSALLSARANSFVESAAPALSIRVR